MVREKKQQTKRDLQAMERREQLLAAATGLFAAKGYHATPVREINRTIGMADGLLYHYFPGGKLEILVTIVKEAKVRRIGQFDAFAAEMDMSAPIQQIMLEVFRFLYTMLEKERTILKIQVQEAELLAGEVTQDLERLILDRVEWMHQLIEERIRLGELRPMDAGLAAKQFMSAWISVAFQSLTGINLIQQEPEEYFREMSGQLIDCWQTKES